MTQQSGIQEYDIFLRFLHGIGRYLSANRSKVLVVFSMILTMGVISAVYAVWMGSQDKAAWKALAQLQEEASENDVSPAQWREFAEDLPPTNVRAWGMMVVAERLIAGEDMAGAADILEQMLDLEADHVLVPSARLALARVYEDQGKNEAALEQYTTIAGSEFFVGTDAALGRGRVLFKLGRKDEAAQVFRSLNTQAKPDSKFGYGGNYWADMAAYYLFQIEHGDIIEASPVETQTPQIPQAPQGL